MLSNNNLIDAFLNWQSARAFSPRTIRRRKVSLHQFADRIAPAHLNDATLTDAEGWLATKKSPSTRHAYRSDLRALYSWAVARGHLGNDPTAALDPIKVPRSLPRPFRGDQFLLAFTSARGPRQLMVGFGGFAGLRCAEIAALDWSDISTHTSPPVVVVRAGKGRKDRVVPLHPDLLAALGNPPGAGRVFPGATSESVSAAIRRHLQRCDINGVPHQLRHTFGTTAAAAAHGNMVVVQYLMGHESLSTTMRYVGWAGGPAADVVAQMYQHDHAA